MTARVTAAATPAPDAPDAPTGRNAILRAARRAFTQRPYAEVTIRGIAADAGVSASLVVKHFGRKEELFNTVADFGPAAEELFDAPLDGLGRHMVLTLVRSRRAHQTDPLLRVVFSLGNHDERSLLRTRFHEQVTGRLTARLPGRERALRAELIMRPPDRPGRNAQPPPRGQPAPAPPRSISRTCTPPPSRASS